MLILLAEDDAELRFILSRILMRDGFEVEELCDYRTLVARLERYAGESPGARRKTVLLSDVYMPGGVSIDAVEVLRETLEGLPVIFITSARDEELARIGMQAGATAVLSKPVDTKELKRIIRSIEDGGGEQTEE